jgi:hypothetical protein
MKAYQSAAKLHLFSQQHRHDVLGVIAQLRKRVTQTLHDHRYEGGEEALGRFQVLLRKPVPGEFQEDASPTAKQAGSAPDGTPDNQAQDIAAASLSWPS